MKNINTNTNSQSQIHKMEMESGENFKSVLSVYLIAAIGTILMFLFSNKINAQSETDEQVTSQKSDTSRLTFGENTEVLIINKNVTEKGDKDKKDKDEAGNNTKCGKDDDDMPKGMGMGFMQLGLTDFTSASGLFTLPAEYSDYELKNSFRTQINIFNDDIHFVKNKLVLFTSLGWQNVALNFAKNQSIVPDSDSMMFAAGPTGIKLKKNQLDLNYINASAMLEACLFEKVHAGFGASMGYNITNSYTTKYKNNETKIKSRIGDDYNVNPWKAELMAKVGYKSFNIFATYSPPAFNQLTETFTRDSGAMAVRPYSVGIILIGNDND